MRKGRSQGLLSNAPVRHLFFSFLAFLMFLAAVEICGQFVFRVILQTPFDNRLKPLLDYQRSYFRQGGYETHPDVFEHIDGVPIARKGNVGNKYGKYSASTAGSRGRAKIILVGDSMMEQKALVSGTSEIMQGLADGCGFNADILNYARSGYNLLQEAALIRGLFVDFDPEQIWWVLFIHNDFEDTIPNDVGGIQHQRDLKAYRGLAKVYENLFLSGFVYGRFREVVLDHFPEFALHMPRGGVYGRSYRPMNYISAQKGMFHKNFKKYLADVARTVDAARMRNIAVKLFILQDHKYSMVNYWDSEVGMMLDELRNTYGLPVVSLKDDFLRYDLSAIYDETGHFNHYGAKVAADILAKYVFPPDCSAGR